MIKPKNYPVTKNTKKVSLRLPHSIIALVENESNQSAALIELLIIGAKVKYGINLEKSA